MVTQERRQQPFWFCSIERSEIDTLRIGSTHRVENDGHRAETVAIGDLL